MKLLSSIVTGYDILPQFVRHYREQGVDEFYFLTFTEVDAKIDGCNFMPTNIERKNFTAILEARLLNELKRKIVKKDEWVVTADLDEFCVVGNRTLLDVSKEETRRAAFAVKGTMVDRVTEDGSIPARLEEDLWRQFPVDCNITRKIRNGCVSKVILSRNSDIFVGHHHPQKGINVSKQVGIVYHFHWWGDLIGLHKEKYDRNQRFKKEHELVINYLNQNKKFKREDLV